MWIVLSAGLSLFVQVDDIPVVPAYVQEPVAEYMMCLIEPISRPNEIPAHASERVEFAREIVDRCSAVRESSVARASHLIAEAEGAYSEARTLDVERLFDHFERVVCLTITDPAFLMHESRLDADEFAR